MTTSVCSPTPTRSPNQIVAPDQLVAPLNPKYLMDDLTLDKGMRGITGKEMKYLYRNRDEKHIKKRVNFWKDGERAQAPWESDPETWQKYEQYRQEKHKNPK